MGSTLYGTTCGGLHSRGTIYKVKTDGTGYRVLHTFTGGEAGNWPPTGPLVLHGSTLLYGTTGLNGTHGWGTIYKINTDGTGYHVLHTFAFGGDPVGNSPNGLTLVGSALYGTASGGGAHWYGTIFKINTD